MTRWRSLLVPLLLAVAAAVAGPCTWELVQYEDHELGFRVSVPADWGFGPYASAITLDSGAEARFSGVTAFTSAVGAIWGFGVKVLQPPQKRLLFELPLEAAAELLFAASFPDGRVLERSAGAVSGTPATIVRYRGPSGQPGRDMAGVVVTVRGSNTIYVLTTFEQATDPQRHDPLLERVVASFALDAWAALERGDFAIAINALQPAAEQGQRLARAWLGHLHEHGFGVQQDHEEALRWYQLAAEQGSPMARRSVGSMYERGIGVAQDHAEALRWYRLAAEQGCGFSQAAIERLAGGWRGGE